jgi:hypothetical protein
MDHVHDTQTLTLAQLKRAIKAVKKHEHLGFYLEAEDVSTSKEILFIVSLRGPTVKWKRKVKIIMTCEV